MQRFRNLSSAIRGKGAKKSLSFIGTPPYCYEYPSGPRRFSSRCGQCRNEVVTGCKRRWVTTSLTSYLTDCSGKDGGLGPAASGQQTGIYRKSPATAGALRQSGRGISRATRPHDDTRLAGGELANLQSFKTCHRILVVVTVILTSHTARAIPAFARMYGTSCSTCHIDFPKLNDFGKAFKDAGFKFPKDDAAVLKIPPVMLGAPANKELWPKAIWPGTIPGIPPIGFQMSNYFQYTGTSKSNFNSLTPQGSLPPFIPTTDFQTGIFSLFTAGNFGSDIAFWVGNDISLAGSNSNAGLGDAYLKFVNVGKFLKLPQNALNFRVGQFELELPFTQSRSIWISPYDIYIQSNIGATNSAFALQQFVNNHWVFAATGRGAELSGGLHTGGYNYSIAVIDQVTDGGGGNSPYVPSATSSNRGGLGFVSDANFKDIYATFNYRFNLEKDQQSRTAIQAAGPTGPHDHTYLNFGSYYSYGRSVQRLLGTTTEGTATTLTAREPFYRVGGNFTFNFRCCLQVNGLYMFGHDMNLRPADANGVAIPIQDLGQILPVGFVRSTSATFSGGFVDVEWLAYPWLYVMFRYDGVNSTSDRINALIRNPNGSGFTQAPFNASYGSTRNRFTPAVQFLIHPNIKAEIEYQFRPSQSVLIATNPLTGLPVAISPFHTNTLVLGLIFAY